MKTGLPTPMKQMTSSKKKLVICPSGLPYIKDDKQWTPKNWIQIKT
jgi:hypothetical protein